MHTLRTSHARAFAVLALGLFGDPAGAGQEATDMKLEDAGFVMRMADSAEKIKHAQLLPPRKFIARTKAGQRYYVYADPDFCKCVFVGNENAMKTYRDMVAARAKNLAPTVIAPSGMTPETLMVEDMNSDVSSLIDDGNILDWKF